MKRRARVAVRNNTSDPLIAVGVVHKYSDVYKDQGSWGVIQPGEISEANMGAEYNTGFLTTGRDWWYVTWFNADVTKRSYSNPNNFRGAIDAVEGADPLTKATKTQLAAAVADNAPGVALAWKTTARELSKVTSSPMFNSEGTEGFKQHILREEDEGAVTEIVINGDGTIQFQSKSGESATVYATKDV